MSSIQDNSESSLIFMKRIKDYALISGLLTRNLTRRISFQEKPDVMRKILKDHPKLLIAMNHGPMLGPMAAIMALAELYMASEGENRKPLAIMWRQFYRIPIWKYVIQYLTQVDHGLGFDECIEKMKNEGFTDLLVMPEGENCNFGNGVDIEPFLSPRFIELALQLDVPILILVHHGSEQWAKTISISKRLAPLFRVLPKKDYARIVRTRRLSLPTRASQIDDLKVAYTLYQPALRLTDLPEDRASRRDALAEEAMKVRAIMQDMSNSLK